jgi:hypothetical protein
MDAETQNRIDQWVSELDNQQFNVRDKASQELEKLGERATPSLRKALKRKPSLEARRKLEQLLERLEGFPLSPERLREIRAVEALEHIGSTEARQLLQSLATGVPEARLTREAKASLDRLQTSRP